MAHKYPVMKFEAVVTCEVTYNQNCALSLYFDQYEYAGGAHGITVQYSDTWNVRSGKRIRLSDMFPKNKHYEAELIQNIIVQIERQMKDGTGAYFDDYRKLAAKTFDPKNFYLVPAGIIIYYQQYDIAPYSSGIPKFLIPYDTVGAKEPDCLHM